MNRLSKHAAPDFPSDFEAGLEPPLSFHRRIAASPHRRRRRNKTGGKPFGSPPAIRWTYIQPFSL
jgi:hypothetical protein